jgi:hypothetical protein
MTANMYLNIKIESFITLFQFCFAHLMSHGKIHSFLITYVGIRKEASALQEKYRIMQYMR